MKDPKSLIEYSNKIQDIYKNIEEYILSRKCNVFIVFGDMIADMTSNKKLKQQLKYLLEEENNKFLLFLSHNFILWHQKMLD